jgi:hypothetical protein
VSRYSQLYIERGQRIPDSLRFRNRLAAFFYRLNRDELGHKIRGSIVASIHEDLGCQVPFEGAAHSLPRFIRETEIRDVLDAITIAARVITAALPRGSSPQWQKLVARVFEEENLSYRLGPDDVVHPFIDVEFEVTRAATIAALGGPQFGEARRDFDAALRHLRDGEHKQAIRAMFPAVETAAKVLYPGRFARLDVSAVQRDMSQRLDEKYVGNQPAITAGRGLLRSFEQWIVASQPYRHGQEVQEPTEPPQDLAVAHISTGATFLRWMIELSA